MGLILYGWRGGERLKTVIIENKSHNQLTMDDLPTRWEVELEFVQSLANMQYLTYLAQTGHLEDEKFLNYLEYLEYWRKPEYAKQLVYPNCLHILTLLRSPQFRKEIAKTDMSSIVYNDMVERWREPLSTANGSKTQQNGIISAGEVKEGPMANGSSEVISKDNTDTVDNNNNSSMSPVDVKSAEKSEDVVHGEGNGSVKQISASSSSIEPTESAADTSAMEIDS